jgi:hypothetical protein
LAAAKSLLESDVPLIGPRELQIRVGHEEIKNGWIESVAS